MHFAVGTKTSYETKMFLCPKRLPKNPCVFAELPLFRFSLAISLYEQIFPGSSCPASRTAFCVAPVRFSNVLNRGDLIVIGFCCEFDCFEKLLLELLRLIDLDLLELFGFLLVKSFERCRSCADPFLSKVDFDILLLRIGDLLDRCLGIIQKLLDVLRLLTDAIS